MTDWIEGTVTSNLQWNSNLCSLQIQAPLPEFEAGQFVRVGLEIDGEIVVRPYSLVNPPSDPMAEIYFNRVVTGPLSPRLFTLKPGDKLLISPVAAGFFVLSEIPAAKHLWLLATGTGVGPYLSMLRTAVPWRRFEIIIVVIGVKEAEDLGYQELIQRFVEEHPTQFRYLTAITREIGVGDINTRISDAIASGLLEEKAEYEITAEGSQVMICGNPNFVADCLTHLKAKGLKKNLRSSPGQITREIYK